MNLSLSKLPWHAQIGAFVVVCLGAVFGFWKFYVSEVQADIAQLAKQTADAQQRKQLANARENREDKRHKLNLCGNLQCLV